MHTVTERSWLDRGLPVGLAVMLAIETVAMDTPNLAAVLAVQVTGCLVLVWRRRFTLVSCLVSGWLLAVSPFFGTEMNDLAAPILAVAVICYSLARWPSDYRGLVVVAAILLGITGDYFFTDDRDNNISDVFFVSALLLPPYVVGRIARKLAAQSELLARQQDLVRETAIRDERDRIARELHDVIAHSVSAMVVQTAAAQDLVRRDPSAAESVLADVAATGRRALAETGRLLHVIRDTDGELGLAPTPGLAQVPELVDRFRADGLAVDVDLDPSLPSLPAGVDVSAYRIVQEALTNALRYSSDRSARLAVRGTPGGVRIHATNPSNGTSGAGSGLGLVGMKERVSVLGGTLEHGTSRPGVFEVHATLPVDA
ncbi:MAG TPA: histidine kinase [Marmoricola sp.]